MFHEVPFNFLKITNFHLSAKILSGSKICKLCIMLLAIIKNTKLNDIYIIQYDQHAAIILSIPIIFL